jgi:hypothetical protein
MFGKHTPLGISILAALAAVFIAPPAAADHDDDPEAVDVEIEGLSGKLKTAPDGWYLYVEYDVEVEDRLPETPLDLVLFASEHGRALLDKDQQPIDAVIRLDQPTEIDDEYDFEEAIRLHVPRDAVDDPYSLRVHALVFFAGTDQPLESKARSVRYDYPRPHYQPPRFYDHGIGHNRYYHHRYYRRSHHYRFGLGFHFGRHHHARHRFRYCR